MTAPKAGTYVLVASAFYRVEGEGDEATRRRYKRGDRVELSKAEAARLAVPTRLAGPTFIPAKDAGEVPAGDDLATAPPVTVNRTSEANQLIAEANTGINIVGTGSGGDGASVTGDGDPVPVTVDGKPAKSATAEVWRDYAVKAGAVPAAEADNLNKAQLQKAVEDHERA